MRCCYFSDLHLESQDFGWRVPEADVLIVAGDLCNASALDPARTDLYAAGQRDRVQRFLDAACAAAPYVLFVAGNHEHYDGVFEKTAGLLKRHMPQIVVLDNESVEIGGVRFFGSTLWTDFERRNPVCMDAVRRAIGDFFFVRTRDEAAEEADAMRRFRPEDALAQFDACWSALRRAVATDTGNTIVITHHAPSLKGLNPQFAGNGRDGAFASDLDAEIERLAVPVWVHGHTHVARSYRVGDTMVHANCRGYDGKDRSAGAFRPARFFEIG